MARKDRLHFLTSLFNMDVLNEIDRINKCNTYHPILGVWSRIIPDSLRTRSTLLKFYIAFISFFYPLWGLFFVLLALFCWLFERRRICFGEKVFLLSTVALPRVVKNASISFSKDDVWLNLPWKNYKDAEGLNTISVFSLLSFFDILQSYYDSIVVVLYTIKKKGIKYVLPTLLSFRWFLYDKAIRKIPLTKELYFANHKDSFAALFKYLPHTRKCLIQHGKEIVIENAMHIGANLYEYNNQYKFWSNKLPVRYKDLYLVYCFTEKERIAMSSSVINCSPEVKYVGYPLKQFNDNCSGEKAILIVGYSALYIKIEASLIKQFQGTGIKIYLKNHPTLPVSSYKEIQNSFDFVLLNGPIFPKVDVVFSYSSTLALEYEALGVKIVYFDSLSEKELSETISNVIEYISKG